jgi:hypothetical protein
MEEQSWLSSLRLARDGGAGIQEARFLARLLTVSVGGSTLSLGSRNRGGLCVLPRVRDVNVKLQSSRSRGGEARDYDEKYELHGEC